MIDIADWIIIAFLLISLGIGWWGARKTANNAESYFLAGRDMPCWILVITNPQQRQGVSAVLYP
ncbi:MAG: hypothetical protein ISR39_10880 [Akkermansiaceae bacterium]|nr:hypothetical protein [Akkermansiaceae bacterium]